MTRVAQSSPNTLTVADDSGTAIGTLLTSMMGFVAFTATGKSLGGFSTMESAMAALRECGAQQMTARVAKSALILIVDSGKYKGCMLSRGVKGYTAYDACDRALGDFETAQAAHEAVLKAFAA